MKTTVKVLVMTCLISLIGFTSPIYSQCERGGRGATQCEFTFTEVRWLGLWTVTTTHSVSCGEGMYACCTYNGAGCVYNRPTYVQA